MAASKKGDISVTALYTSYTWHWGKFDSAELSAMGERFLRGLPVSEYPHMVEHVRYHLDDPNLGLEGDFSFGLDLILEGLERRRDTL